MSTDTSNDGDAEIEDMDAPALREQVAALTERLDDVETAVDDGDGQRKMTIIATKGSLDMAYPPLILASTAAAFDWDVTVFHTFWGLDILHEEKASDLKLSAVGNPSMSVPNMVASLPGMDAVATRMMERKIDENGTATVEELIETSLDMGVDLQACQMTMELLGYEDDELYDGVTTGVGAATALQGMADSDIQLLV